MIIVGIGHKSRQGKDEFANFLATFLRVNTRNKKIVKAGFADILKAQCHQLYGWAGVQEAEHYERYPDDRNKIIPHIGKNVVQLWIDYGNHAREYDGNIWLNALIHGSKADVLLIKDMRFENEFNAVYDVGGLTVKVTRPGFDGLTSVSDNALNGETRWHHDLVNCHDLKHLYSIAENFGRQHVLPKLGY